jgi:hypothetical protein
MNNSARKSNLTNLFNNLSETSNDFLTEINQNLNKLRGGGKCSCIDALKAFNAENADLGLYILKEKNCCFCCKDDNGNALLHHIVLCCTKHSNNNKCMNALSNALKLPNVSDFIDIQNSDGTTPILLAVEAENEVVANKLDEAGADKSIADNTGNYLQTEDIPEPKTVNLSETPNEQVCINNIVKLVVNDKTNEPELSSLNLTSTVDNSSNVLNSLPAFSSDNSDAIAEKVKDKIIKTFGINKKTDAISSLGLGLTSSENFLDTDKFINFLSDKYNKKPPASLNELMGNSDLTSSDNITHDMNLLNETTSRDGNSDESIATEIIINALSNKLSKESKPFVVPDENIENVDTDVLMRAIDNIRSSKKMSNMNVNVLEGGGKKEKIMGYRKLTLHSDNSDNIYSRVNEKSVKELHTAKTSKSSKYSKKASKLDESSINLDLYYSDGESGVSNNELSRLINSRKNDLHNEVINMVMGMLNKGLITKNSKPVEASERNAKLIKSFLYRVVSEKNPQLTGMDKILMIKKMNDKEIVDSLSKMPDLDDLEENIRKHIEERQKARENEQNTSEKKPSKKNKQEKNDDTEEKPKKKSKKIADQSRTKIVKKTSKKNSKKSSKK